MITRTSRLGLLVATLAIVASACSGSATPTPAAPCRRGPVLGRAVDGAPRPPRPSRRARPRLRPASALKIGVVTDIGTLNDKGFNEYSYKGAVDARDDARRGDPVPRSSRRTPPSTRRTSSSSSTRSST